MKRKERSLRINMDAIVAEAGVKRNTVVVITRVQNVTIHANAQNV